MTSRLLYNHTFHQHLFFLISVSIRSYHLFNPSVSYLGLTTYQCSPILFHTKLQLFVKKILIRSNILRWSLNLFLFMVPCYLEVSCGICCAYILLMLQSEYSTDFIFLEWCQLVFSSSATVYGWPKEVPCTEEFPLKTTNPYGRTKVWLGDC